MANSPELLFKIRADGSNAEAELKKVEAAIKNLGGGGGVADLQKGFHSAASEASSLVGIFTGNSLTGATSQITSFSGAISAIPGPAGLAIGAVAGLTAVAVTLVAALFELTNRASEYGSEMHDLADKTGLSAEMTTAFKVAADNSSSSVETMTKATGKFAKLLGEAADGNEKAQQTLKTLGVTSYDLDTALGQVTKTIFNAKDGTEQITLAQKAFGKSGIETIPIIKQMGGDTEAYTRELERLGAVLTEKDIIASDAFGDSLGMLKAQASAAAVAFSQELMGVAVQWFTAASEWYARNKDEVRAWGHAVAEIATLVGHAIGYAFDGMNRIFDIVGNMLSHNADAWAEWAGRVRLSIGIVTLGLSELAIKAINAFIQEDRALRPHTGGGSQEGVGRATGGSFEPGGGDSGGGGGKGGGGKEKDTRFADAKKRAEEMIKLFKDSAANRFKENEIALDKIQASEESHAQAKFEMERADLDYQKGQYEQILNMDGLTLKQREEIQSKIDDITTKSYGAQLDLDKALLKGQLEDDQIDYENYKKTLAEKEKAHAEHLRALAEQRRKANAEAKTELSESEKENIKQKNSLNLSILGDSPLSIRNDAGNLIGTLKPILPLLQDMGQMVHNVAGGFGQLLNTWILMGSAGPHAVKKMVAQVISSFAEMAAVQALMELAYGVAALTPWGFAIYGDPSKHFHAAALLGAAALGAAGVGRLVAGNSFKDSSGSSSSSSNAGASDYYTHPPDITRQTGTANQAGGDQPLHRNIFNLQQAIQDLKDRITNMSPGDVLTVGANQKPGFIGQQTVNDVRRDSSIGAGLQVAFGFR